MSTCNKCKFPLDSYEEFWEVCIECYDPETIEEKIKDYKTYQREEAEKLDERLEYWMEGEEPPEELDAEDLN